MERPRDATGGGSDSGTTPRDDGSSGTTPGGDGPSGATPRDDGPIGTAPRRTWAKIALLARTPRRGRGFWYGLAVDVIWPWIMAFTKPVWRGHEHLPRTGPVLIAANHLSFADPITCTAYTLAGGRIPRYLAKASLWTVPVVRSVLGGGGHIPVHRDSSRPGGAYADAVEALTRGECVLVFPEGTFTDDPDGWPMRGRTGAARIALTTGAPVLPMAHWGSNHVLPHGSARPRLLPRRTVTIELGPPVDLDDLRAIGVTDATLAEATRRIMGTVTAMLGDIRGESPPPSRDPDPDASAQPTADRPGAGPAVERVADRPGSGDRVAEPGERAS